MSAGKNIFFKHQKKHSISLDVAKNIYPFLNSNFYHLYPSEYRKTLKCLWTSVEYTTLLIHSITDAMWLVFLNSIYTTTGYVSMTWGEDFPTIMSLHHALPWKFILYSYYDINKLTSTITPPFLLSPTWLDVFH